MSDAASAGTTDTQVRPGQRLLSEWMYDASKSADEGEIGAGGVMAAADTNSADEGEIGAGGVMAAVDEALLKMGRQLEQTGIAIEMRGDGGYDTRKIFSLLAKLGIAPIIKVRINSNARAGGVDRARAMAVLEQLGGKGGCTNRNLNRMKSERLANQKDWKKKVGYGLRWIVVIVISAFKRVFGQYGHSRHAQPTSRSLPK